jgi:beta-glucosidase-like glycosyl hydrolase
MAAYNRLLGVRQRGLEPSTGRPQAGLGLVCYSDVRASPCLGQVYCCEHEWLLGRILRDEWGYGGLVVSDWCAP